MEQSSENRERTNWFDLMDGFLKWKIIAPDIFNPFKPPVPDRVLAELAHRKEALKRMFDVRCLCDGYEVLRVRNMAAPQFVSDHPCITILPKTELLRVLEQESIDTRVEEEVERMQSVILAELERREEESSRYSERKKKKAPKPEEKKEKTPKPSSFRVIRM